MEKLKTKRAKQTAIKILVLALAMTTIPKAQAIPSTPLGHYEPLMANTGTALTESSSGVIYNPALLGTLTSSSVSASASTFYLASGDIGTGSISSLNSVPDALIATWKMGSGSLGVSLLVADAIELDLTTEFPNPIVGAGGDTLKYETNISQSTNLFGVTWGQGGYKCGGECRVSWGTSLFVDYSMRRQSIVGYSSDATGASVYSVASSGRTTATSLLPMFGILVESSPKFAYGVRLEAPALLLSKKRTGTLVGTQYNTGTSQQQQSVGDAVVEYRPLPQWGLGLGFQWKPSAKWLWVSDFYLAERARSPDDDETVGNRPNIFIGGGERYSLSENWGLLSGVRFELDHSFGSRAPKEARSFFCDVTGGVSWKTQALESTIGIFFAKAVVLQSPDDTSSADSGLSQLVGLSMSGVYRF